MVIKSDKMCKYLQNRDPRVSRRPAPNELARKIPMCKYVQLHGNTWKDVERPSTYFHLDPNGDQADVEIAAKRWNYLQSWQKQLIDWGFDGYRPTPRRWPPDTWPVTSRTPCLMHAACSCEAH